MSRYLPSSCLLSFPLWIMGILLSLLSNPSYTMGNLTPYKISDWSDKIVVSYEPGRTTDSNPLYASDTLYISWAVINDGSTKISSTSSVDLYVDGIKIKTFQDYLPLLDPNVYFWCRGCFEIGSLKPGEHTVRIVADSTGVIQESNESDNIYDKKFNVLANEVSSRLAWKKNGHSYQRIENPVTWTEAKIYCESQGSYLATVTSSEESDFIFSQFSGRSLWLGGTDAGQEGTWSWVNNEPWSYSNWYPGEPNNADNNEHYLMSYDNQTWNDTPDNSKFWFVCEWDSTSTPSSSSHAINLTISTVSPSRYRLIGTLVDANNQPACGLALASGRCVFTCGPGSPRCEGGTDSLPLGQFDLTGLPTEANGTLNLQTFASSSMPGLQVVQLDGTAQLVNSGVSQVSSRAINTSHSEASSGRYRLIGTLVDANNQPACGLALASGRCVFTCGPGSPRCEGGTDSLPLGQFNLTDLPTEANGTLNLQTFVFGSLPGLQVVNSGNGKCSFAITPQSKQFSAQAGSEEVTVSTQNGCSWTAKSNATWITINSGASGTGSGTVKFTVSANPSEGVPRSGSLTIAGQEFTVSQAAPSGPPPDNS